MRIEILSECDSSTIEKVHEAFDRLLPQLSSSARPLSREEIQKLPAQECLHLVCALDERGGEPPLPSGWFPSARNQRLQEVFLTP